MITRKYLREILDYHPDGFLVWKKPPSRRVSIGRIAGSPRPDGYCSIGVKGQCHLAHRLIYLWHHGRIPKYIDHINRNKNDNRIENLRDSRGLNNANRTKLKNTSSKYIGVTWDKSKRKWQVVCKEKFVGRFISEKEAAQAYNQRAVEVFGEHANLNPI